MRFIRRLVFPDGSWIEGSRGISCTLEETGGCMRLIVKDASPDLKYLVGKKVTASNGSIKFWYTVE